MWTQSCLLMPRGPLLSVSPGTFSSLISGSPDLPVSQRHTGMVSCGPSEAQWLPPLSDFANTHTPGACHPPGPEPSTCSINRLVIRVPSYKQWLPDQCFCQLAFSHHHLSGRPASIPESCTESSITSLWVQMLTSVQEWCEHERLQNQKHPGLFHT